MCQQAGARQRGWHLQLLWRWGKFLPLSSIHVKICFDVIISSKHFTFNPPHYQWWQEAPHLLNPCPFPPQGLFNRLVSLTEEARKAYKDMVSALEQEQAEEALKNDKKTPHQLGHYRNHSAASAISFCSILSEPISEVNEKEYGEQPARLPRQVWSRPLPAFSGMFANQSMLNSKPKNRILTLWSMSRSTI